MRTKPVVVILIVFAALAVAAGVWYVSPLYQKTKLFIAAKQIDALVQDGKPVAPEHGGVVQCANGEWIVVVLHHGSRGFTIIRTSSGRKYAEVDYNPHPVIECWGTIIHGNGRDPYLSVDDFFKKNPSIRWVVLN